MMGPLSSISSLQMALTETVYFMVVLTTCSTQECRLQIEEKLTDRSAFLTKTDIKLFQSECMEDSCHQSSHESKRVEETDGSSAHQENQFKVLTERCGSVICGPTSQCLEGGCKKSCVKAPSLCDLHNASDNGDLSRVKAILSQGRTNIDCQEWIGRSPVMWAARKGHRDVVELLVNKGADVALLDKFGINILHCACLGGDVEVVKYVLSQNMVDINSGVLCRRTPVMLAAENGYKVVVELLVENGARLSIRDHQRHNILHLACLGGHMEVVKYILSLNKVDIDSRGWKMRTPVMLAGQSGHKQVVELLVKHGADLSLADKEGHNILHLTCPYGRVDVVKYILSLHYVDINSRGWKMRTPVMLAGQRGHKQVVELLVKHGADPSLTDREGHNILHLACPHGRVDVMKYILSLHYVDINSRGWKMRTPVMVAGQSGHKQMVELLVKHGADLSLTDKEGNNILHLVCPHGRVDVIKYILSLHYVDINSRGWRMRTPVMLAGQNRQKQVVELLVKQGADLSLTDKEGNNILHLACPHGRVDVVKYILSLHYVDINSRGWTMRTPVMVAGQKGHKHVVELLVKHGADPSLTDKEGNNILHLACPQGRVDVIKYILSLHYVDINSRGWRMRTPVMLAGQSRHKQVVELLVKHGADLSLTDKEGNNILHLACPHGRVDVVKYILSLHYVDINSRGWKMRTPVMLAGQRGHKQVVELLVRHGADLSLTDKEGNNILHLACLGGHTDVGKYVMSLNMVDINSRSKGRKTPVMLAKTKGHKQMVDLLVKHGAYV